MACTGHLYLFLPSKKDELQDGGENYKTKSFIIYKLLFTESCLGVKTKKDELSGAHNKHEGHEK
jgi:hypothetical protein